jgi:peptidoglycan-associated lipoprotein
MLSQRMLLTLALLGPAFAFGCSHQQPPPETAANEAPAPAPAKPQKKAAEPAPAPVAEAPAGTEIFFDFDSANLRDDARPILQKVASDLKTTSSKQVRIEGNCDDLGTPEYNVALGEQRARAAKDYLTRLGVPEDRIQVVSYGAERPKYLGQDNDSRAKNRRDDLVMR